MLLKTNLHQHSVIALCAALAVLICVTLPYALSQWHRDWLLTFAGSTNRTTIANTTSITDMIAAIPAEHLFGKSITSGGNMPISNLQLRVTGIVKVEDEEYGSYSKAYISIAGQPSKIYQVGESLPYGVKVYDISSDAVVLESDGHLEKLPLPREQLLFKPQAGEESQ